MAAVGFRLMVVTVVACWLAGCGGDSVAPAGSSGFMNRKAERSREEHYQALSQRFGEHVLREDWVAAHGMLSSSLKARLSESALADAFRSQYAEYHAEGKPIAVGGDTNTVDPGDLNREDYEIPESVPTTPRWEAYTFAVMVLEGTVEETDRCYDICLLWVKEDGQDRVAHFDHEWCD